MRFYDDHDEADHAAVQVPVHPATPPPGRRAHSTNPATRLEIARLIERQGGHAESPGGTIEATVDATGRITAIWLDPRLSALPLDQLADHIAATCADAFNQRLDAIAQIARDHTDTLNPDLATQIAVMTTHLKQMPLGLNSATGRTPR